MIYVKKLPIIILLTLVSCLPVCAKEELVLHLKSGGQITFALEEKPVITFEGENMLVKSKTANYSVPIGDIDSYDFTMEDPVTISAKDYAIKYGDELPIFEFTSEGAEVVGTPSITCEATKTSPVGTYPIVISKGSVTNNDVTCVNGTLTIEKAPLKITAKDYTIKQGEALPVFEATYEGFKNNETSGILTKQPVFSTTATSASEPDVYEITVSGAEAQNYEITHIKGKLTIVDADALIITAKSYTIKYGDKIPAFEFTSDGAALEGTPSITCEAAKTSSVGTYPIIISKGSVTNYNVTYVNGTLTIKKAPLKITAKDYTIKQGEALPTFEATYDGFKNDETSVVLTKQPVFSTTATSASEPDVYDITVSGAEAQNYEMSYVSGKLTIEETTEVGIVQKNASKPTCVNGHVIFSQLKAGSKVYVYAVDGRQLRLYTADNMGFVDVNLTTLPKGIYILKNPDTEIKITNR